MEILNKTIFVSTVMDTHSLDRNSVGFDIFNQDINRFVKVQGDEFFMLTDLPVIIDVWHKFQNN
jgi:hypothetical protein